MKDKTLELAVKYFEGLDKFTFVYNQLLALIIRSNLKLYYYWPGILLDCYLLGDYKSLYIIVVVCWYNTYSGFGSCDPDYVTQYEPREEHIYSCL